MQTYEEYENAVLLAIVEAEDRWRAEAAEQVGLARKERRELEAKKWSF